MKALVTPNEWNWEEALEILADNLFDMEGAVVIKLTEQKRHMAPPSKPTGVNVPHRRFVSEWEGVEE